MGAPIYRTSEKVTLRSGGLGTRLSPKFDRNLTATGCLSLSLKENDYESEGRRFESCRARPSLPYNLPAASTPIEHRP
jgi:hypothetical protein